MQQVDKNYAQHTAEASENRLVIESGFNIYSIGDTVRIFFHINEECKSGDWIGIYLNGRPVQSAIRTGNMIKIVTHLLSFF